MLWNELSSSLTMSESITSVSSPAGLAWKKFLRHKSGMFGLCCISAAFLLSVFCYWLAPDNTSDCNQMNVQVSLMPPGSEVRFIAQPLTGEVQESGVMDILLNGRTPRYKFIPVAACKIGSGYFLFREFTGHSGSAVVLDSLPLTSLVKFNKNGSDADAYLVAKRFWLGTDRFGRDLLSRLMLGARVSMSVGLIAVLISLVIGIGLGALAGYFRGWVDKTIVWLINVVWSIPTLLLVVAITLALGKGFVQVFIAVGLTMWVEVARIVRGQFFSLREQQFVEAGKALGYGNTRIIFRHILPNILGPVIVIAASNFASAILLEAGLSFLGMGAQPPTPSWGMMIKENYAYIVVDAAWLAILPGAAIALMVLSFTLLGNGLRDAFDTRSA